MDETSEENMNPDYEADLQQLVNDLKNELTKVANERDMLKESRAVLEEQEQVSRNEANRLRGRCADLEKVLKAEEEHRLIVEGVRDRLQEKHDLAVQTALMLSGNLEQVAKKRDAALAKCEAKQAALLEVTKHLQNEWESELRNHKDNAWMRDVISRALEALATEPVKI